MREIDNSVCRKMIFVLVVRSGHSRPVIKIHYLAPCSVVQADFREKIDSPDRDFCMDTQVGAEYDVICVEVTFINSATALCCDVGKKSARIYNLEKLAGIPCTGLCC